MKLNFQGKHFKVKMMYCEKRPAGNMWELVVDITNDDIIYIENYNRNTFVYTEMGEYLITATFGIVKKLLQEDNRFQYTHGSYLVNTEKVNRIDAGEVVLLSRNKEYRVPLAKSKQKEFTKAFGKFTT